MNHSRIAQGLLYLVAAGAGYFGLSYLLKSVAGDAFAAAYHQRLAGGIAFASLQQPALYHTLIGVIGALYTALAAGSVAITYFGIARREPWAWHALLALDVTALSLLVLVNLRNGLASPWWLNAVLLLLVLGAFLLDQPARPTGATAAYPRATKALLTVFLLLAACYSTGAQQLSAGPAGSAAPPTYRHRLTLLAGLAQPILLRGGNFSVNYGLTDKIMLQTSWGFGLDYTRLFNSADERLYRETLSPVTAGVGVGYMPVRHLTVWVEPGFASYRVQPRGGDLLAYTTFSLGGSLTYNLLLGKGLTLQPAVKYWPKIASTLSSQDARFTDPDGQPRVHEARAAGSNGLILNLSVGWTFPNGK